MITAEKVKEISNTKHSQLYWRTIQSLESSIKSAALIGQNKIIFQELTDTKVNGWVLDKLRNSGYTVRERKSTDRSWNKEVTICIEYIISWE